MPGQRVDTKEAWEAWVVEEADREGILKETCRSMRRRVDVDHSHAAPARCIPTLNPKVVAGPTTTKSRNEENGRHINITKKVVSEFGVTLGLQGVPDDPTTKHNGVPSEDHHPNGKRSCTREATRRNPTKRVSFLNPELEVAPPSESRTNSPKRACHDDVCP